MNHKEIYKSALLELELKDGGTRYKYVIPEEVIHTEMESFETSEQSITLPTIAGRSSESENSSNGLVSKGLALTPVFNIEELRILEHLAVYNRHVSMAVENIITLANTEFTISFPDSVPDKLKKQMLDRAMNCINSVYEYSDGSSSLINDLLAQAAINGCISIEAIPSSPLKLGLKKVVRVSPKTVRFSYDPLTDDYMPHQLLLGVPLQNLKLSNGMISLNPATYKYIAMRRFNESPYAVPPFLSALEDLVTENDMIGNFKVMMKKMGILGFLSVLVKAPGMLKNETPERYQNRLNNYLDSIEPQVSKQMANSVAIGYKDQHEFKLEGNNLNSQNAENLIKLVKSFVFAGLKQDPNMHGENYSVTETFGRVILGKMSNQMENYQKAVASALEFIVLMDLMLYGYYPDYVQVLFKKPQVGDQLKQAQTDQILIANVQTKYNMGIISQVDAAHELGYEKPDQPEPRVSTAAPSPTITPDPTTSDKQSNSKKIQSMFKKLNAEMEEFDYSVPGGCGEENFDQSFDFRNKKLNKFSKEYIGDIKGIFNKAIKSASANAISKVANTPGVMTKERFSNIVQIELLSSWAKDFVPEIKPVVKMNVNEQYKTWRSDKKPFIDAKVTNSNSFDRVSFLSDIPEATFDLLDYRAIDFFENNDNIYLGKFITDADTQERVKEFVDDWYLKNSAPIGNNTELIALFEQEFADVLSIDSYKIRRVLDTTVNKIRNYANVAYLNQAQIESYEIVEVMDQKTCQWCATMNGKEFSVSKNTELIKNVTAMSPQDGVTLTPFATSIKIDDFKNLSSSDLQSKGISLPAFHPHCRGRVVAVV